MDALLELAEAGLLVVHDQGAPVRELQRGKRILEEALQPTLRYLAEQALLVQ